jgi:hypothetical protein
MNAGCAQMLYFAYGSNMSGARLKARVPSARRIGLGALHGYDLRFHKKGTDGSGKCDAYATGRAEDCVIGVLYAMATAEKAGLDRAEGLGHGYLAHHVNVVDRYGRTRSAMTYYAIRMDSALQPYTWYLRHVLVGARESRIGGSYLQRLASVAALADPDDARDRRERDIHRRVSRRRAVQVRKHVKVR